MKKKAKIILLVCLALLLAVLAGGLVYVSDYYHADAQALSAMSAQTDGVDIETLGGVA